MDVTLSDRIRDFESRHPPRPIHPDDRGPMMVIAYLAVAILVAGAVAALCLVHLLRGLT